MPAEAQQQQQAACNICALTPLDLRLLVGFLASSCCFFQQLPSPVWPRTFCPVAEHSSDRFRIKLKALGEDVIFRLAVQVDAGFNLVAGLLWRLSLFEGLEDTIGLFKLKKKEKGRQLLANRGRRWGLKRKSAIGSLPPVLRWLQRGLMHQRTKISQMEVMKEHRQTGAPATNGTGKSPLHWHPNGRPATLGCLARTEVGANLHYRCQVARCKISNIKVFTL